jgi:hypothetical protein
MSPEVRKWVVFMGMHKEFMCVCVGGGRQFTAWLLGIKIKNIERCFTKAGIGKGKRPVRLEWSYQKMDKILSVQAKSKPAGILTKNGQKFCPWMNEFFFFKKKLCAHLPCPLMVLVQRLNLISNQWSYEFASLNLNMCKYWLKYIF